MSTKLLTKAQREELVKEVLGPRTIRDLPILYPTHPITRLLAHIEEQEKALAYVHWWLNDWKYLRASGCEPHAETYDNALAVVSAALGEKDEVKS